MVRRQRLRLRHVKTSATELAVDQCVGERLRINQRTAPNIDDDRRVLHLLNPISVHHVAGLLRQRGKQDKVIVIGPDLVGILHGNGPVRTVHRVARAVHGGDLHTERLQEADQGFTDTTSTNQGELLVIEEVLLLFEQLCVVPLAVHGLHTVLHGKQEGEGGFGHGVVVKPTRISKAHTVGRMFSQDASLQQTLDAGVLDLHDLHAVGQLIREILRTAAEQHEVRVVLESDILMALCLQRGDGLVFGLWQIRELHACPEYGRTRPPAPTFTLFKCSGPHALHPCKEVNSARQEFLKKTHVITPIGPVVFPRHL